MSKTKRHEMLALHISPNPVWLKREGFTILNSKLKKVSSIGCMVEENGKEGDHPHMHYFFNFDKKPVVLKDFKQKVVGYCKKHFDLPEGEFPSRLVMISVAKSPHYFVEEYMTKESKPISWGDLDIQKYQQIAEKYRVIRLGKDLKPITVKNFRYIYKEYYDSLKVKIRYPCNTTAYVRFITKCFEDGFDTSLLQNKKRFCLEQISMITKQKKFIISTVGLEIEKMTGII